ncbi:cryptochrome/photolyase family protein [Pseudoclavibacter sp. RFBI5]|nr:cryptochrome/photolyase family protein [Pseudoclavibacter sp. RFBI5]
MTEPARKGGSLRLVFPNQLFEEHLAAPVGTRFVLIEHELLFRQYRFHSHKLVLHRASLARFAKRLIGHGFAVEYLESRKELPSKRQLAELIRREAPRRVTWFDVVDDWLERDLLGALEAGGYTWSGDDELESPNFLTGRAEIDAWFSGNDARMHAFYTWQRRRLGLLLDADGEPLGGRWSFDAENRKKLPRGYVPPKVARFEGHPVLQREGTFNLDALLGDEPAAGSAEPRNADVEEAIAWVGSEFPDAPGDPTTFAWPTDADEAQRHLAEFVRERLRDFGPYEDAISSEHPFLNHGLLTPALNIGLLDPRQVVQAALDAADTETPLASLEGFVRQVIGWREYMRATYQVRGRELRTSNALDHHGRLTPGWWQGTTGLEPVDLVISRVLETGYAHHIERLMVLGNAMSLLRIHPDEVYRWFMELFVDAYDWVMVPNVYAMSQFAAGADITTKPYVSGSNYLRKMSDLPAGDWTARWDALYWAFVDDHRAVFARNPRTQMTVALLDRMEPEKRAEHLATAAEILRPSAAGADADG